MISIIRSKASHVITGTLGIVLSMLLAPLVQAQQQPAAVRVDQVASGHCPSLKVFLTVMDAQGLPVTGLESNAFKASVDGSAVGKVKAVPFGESQEGMAVVLVLDTSYSMSGDPIAAQNSAASAFIGSLGDAEKVAIVTFGNTVNLVFGITSKSDEIKQKVEALAADENPVASKLYDGILKAIETVRSASDLPARRAVVVISDGKDLKSDVEIEDCIREANKINLPIYTIGYSKLNRKDRDKYLSKLRRLSKLTRGMYQNAPDASSIASLYSSLGAQLKNIYVLSLAPADLKADGKVRELRISLSQETSKLESDGYNFTIPTNQKCVYPKPPPPSMPAWVMPAAIGGGVGLLLIILLIVLSLRAKKKRLALEARQCPACGDLRPEGSDECPRCIAAQKAAKKKQAPDTLHEDSPPPGAHPPPEPAPGPEPLAQLMIIAGGGQVAKGHSFDIIEQTTVLGRDEDKCQILIPEGKASRVHATIYLGAEGFELHDLESANGTYINEEQITEAPLYHGDEIRIGALKMKFFDKRA